MVNLGLKQVVKYSEAKCFELGSLAYRTKLHGNLICFVQLPVYVAAKFLSILGMS